MVRMSSRWRIPMRGGGAPGVSDPYYFMIYNANKRRSPSTLKSERGLALIKDMAKHADVFTENFGPALSSGWVSAMT